MSQFVYPFSCCWTFDFFFFQFGVITNTGAINTLRSIFLYTYMFISLKYMEVGLLGHGVAACLI